MRQVFALIINKPIPDPLSVFVVAPYYSCPFLVKHLTSCIPVIGGVLFVFVVITLLQTSFTDPGILPRATPDEAADIEKQIGKGPALVRAGVSAVWMC